MKKELQKIGDEPIKDRQYYLDKFELEPNAVHYTYEANDVEKADSPKIK